MNPRRASATRRALLLVGALLLFPGGRVGRAGEGEAYVGAYNQLVTMLIARCQVAGVSPGTLALKDAEAPGGASVSCADLSPLRRKAEELLHRFVKPPPYTLSPWSIDEALELTAFPTLFASRPNGLLIVPARYTRDGQDVTSLTMQGNYNDVPLLWEQLEDLHAVLMDMRVTRQLGDWSAQGETNQRFSEGWAFNLDEARGLANAALPGAALTLVSQSPCMLTTVDRAAHSMGNSYRARILVRGASHCLTGVPPYPHQIRFYAYAREAFYTIDTTRHTRQWDPYGQQGIQENAWSFVGVGVANADGRAVSPLIGPVAADITALDPWAGLPEDPGNLIGAHSRSVRGFEIPCALGLIEWLGLPGGSLGGRPTVSDSTEDGLVYAGCGCTGECEPRADPAWQDMVGHPGCRFPLGVSSGVGGSGVRVQAYMTEYSSGGKRRQMLNLDTYVRSFRDPAGLWHFAMVKRPSGAEVLFNLGAANSGTAIDGGCGRLAYDEGGVYELTLHGSETVVHRFNGNAMSAFQPAGREVGELRVESGNPAGKIKRSGSATSSAAQYSWPGLWLSRGSLAGGRRISGVYSAALTTATPSYGADGFMTAVRYDDLHDTPQAEISVVAEVSPPSTPSQNQLQSEAPAATSLRFESRGGQGARRDQVRVMNTGSETTILRYGAQEEVASSESVLVSERGDADGRSSRRITRLNPDQADESSHVVDVLTASFPWGEETVREVVGPDAADPRVTTFTYHDDPAIAGAFGRLKQEEQPDGAWTRYDYDAAGRLTRETEGLGDAPPEAPDAWCRVRTRMYAGDARLAALGFPASDVALPHDSRPRALIETEHGHEVARTYTAYLADRTVTRRCAAPGAAYDNPANLTTVHRRVPSGAFAGRLASIDHGDGTYSRYTYAVAGAGSWLASTLTTTIEHGVGSESAISHGTRTVTVTDEATRRLSARVEDIASGLVVSDTVLSRDGFGRVTQEVERVTGRVSTRRYGCCGVEHEVDADGLETFTDYTALRQVQATTRGGITRRRRYDARGQVLHAWTEAGALRADEERTDYDAAGRLVQSTNAAGGGSLHVETRTPEGGLRNTIVHADGGVVIERFHRDGTRRDVSGSATAPAAYRYGAAPGERWVQEFRGADTNATEWVRTVQDMLGRQIREEYADGYVVHTDYDAAGREWRRRDGVTTQLTEEDPAGRFSRGAVDMDGDGVLDLAGPDRVSETRTRVGLVAGRAARITDSLVYGEAGATGAVVVATSWSSLDGTESWNVSYGRTSHVHRLTEPGSRRRRDTETSPDGTRVVSVYTNGVLLARDWLAADGTRVTGEAWRYDALQREAGSVRVAANGEAVETEQAYDAAGRVTNVVTRAGALRRETRHHYDGAGHLASTVLPDGGEVRYVYDTRGALLAQEGARQIPLRWTYDDQGRLATLATWRDPAGAPDVTRWEYDGVRGWLRAKRYADGTAVSNAYHPNGALAARTWARGVVTAYAYDAGGSLTNITYSDGTPGVTHELDRRGRVARTRDGSGEHVVSYGAADNRVFVSLPQAPQAALYFSRDAWGRDTNLVLRIAGAPVFDQRWAYDSAGRVAGVQAGAVRADYTYGADGRTVTNLLVAGVHTVSRRFDGFGRLEEIASTAGDGGVRSRSAYVYNDADQRVQQTLADGRVWVYKYDGYGQLVSGRQYFVDGTPVGGRQFEYRYDAIGNRMTTRNERGQHTQTAVYTANAVNQYVQRTTPAELFVTGEARADATVLVKSDAATRPLLANRHGEYFWAALAVSNQAAPVVLTNISIVARWEEIQGAVTAGMVRVETRAATVPASPDVMVHDADGNLLSDGLWTYRWDAENRLVAMESSPALPPDQQRRLEFTYDHQGRRLTKQVYSRAGDDWQRDASHVFLWNGWILLAELADTDAGSTTNLHLWGLDLSDTPDGAGGIGGLLAVTRHPTLDTSFFTYDGTGNILTQLDPNSTPTATYTPGPFGEPLQSSAPQTPWRFSTKYQDPETDLLYFGHRYLSPTTGRWLNRDPLGERGGMNLAAFIHNSPMNYYDARGEWGANVHRDMTIQWASAYLTAKAAEAIGLANEATDGGKLGTGTGWAPWGDQSYHFNRTPNGKDPGGGKEDSRATHQKENLELAQNYCNANNNGSDDPDAAAEHLGAALHALQDIVAHGDYGIKTPGYIVFVHNFGGRPVDGESPYARPVEDYPDRIDLDAKGEDPFGRPVGNAMSFEHGIGTAEYMYGSKRIQKTCVDTAKELREYRGFVSRNGGCKCKGFFITEQQ